MTTLATAWRHVRGIHPALVLAALDLIGLAIASYLSSVELRGELPNCGPLHGCEQVALSEYSRIGGVPVAVFGVVLSLILLSLAIAWWRTNDGRLLAAHYGLSLLGVVFEIYFTYLELFVIGAVCVWCASYGVSLVARFLVALWVWLHRTRYVTAAP
ncbi:MAG TPA: vitamin K epoxide reductase family protein [Verrucomicrobiae bacterium]|nr:vitamin K epoxide reductase family protein [Verrucomicrobiae bacterium]